jgi:hypothetical protein
MMALMVYAPHAIQHVSHVMVQTMMIVVRVTLLNLEHFRVLFVFHYLVIMRILQTYQLELSHVIVLVKPVMEQDQINAFHAIQLI